MFPLKSTPSEDDKIKEGGGGGGVSTDFKGNVGVTVIVPGGEFRRGVSLYIICSRRLQGWAMD